MSTEPAFMPKARKALASVYGFSAFRPGQEEIVTAVLDGKDVLAVMPTGSGKSLCFQLPPIVREGLTLVVSPLIALMRDQVAQLRELGVEAGSVNSSTSVEERRRIARGVRERTLRLLYISPERLLRDDVCAYLRDASIDCVAVDEAHCVSQWGHDFRPEYLRLRSAIEALGDLQTVAVTATADAPTREEIATKLFVRPPQVFVRSFDRPNLFLAMRPKTNATRQLVERLEAHRGESGVIYCASRRRAEELAEELSRRGRRALPYHAGLDHSTRSANHDAFLREDDCVVCATVAFGMGIDKPDVRFVFHADMPASIEAYYQEIGRAGRDGLPADTFTLYSAGDVELRRRQILESGAPDHAQAGRNGQARRPGGAVRDSALPTSDVASHVRRRVSAPAAIATSARARSGSSTGASRRKRRCLRSCALRADSSSAISPTFWRARRRRLWSGMDTTSSRPSASARTGLRPTGGASCGSCSRPGLSRETREDRDRLIVTEEGRRVLRGEAPFALREDLVDAKARRGRPTTAEPHEGDARLLAALKGLRGAIAAAQKQPAYVIFPDRTLIEMAKARPDTLDGLAGLHGVGAVKLQKYGAAFLAVIRDHQHA